MAARTVLLATARWLAVLVPLVDAGLVLTGGLDLRTGVVVALVLEALLAVVLVLEAAAFRRAYRSARREGAARRAAVVAGAEAVWPPVVLRAARAEAGSSGRCGGRCGAAPPSDRTTCRCPTPAASAWCSAR
ncbi:hypothetical protein [Geodermatophilus sp. SYSU D01176]